MTFRKAALTLSFPILFIQAARAQQNFQPGQVVLTNNDTLRGQIDFRDWDISPRVIIFRDQRAGNTVSYSAGQLKSFSVDGETYEGFKVRIYPYTLDAVIIAEGKFDGTPFEKVIFGRVVTKGKMCLYAYKDSLAINYFFVRRGQQDPEQLRINGKNVEASGTLSGNGGAGVAFHYLYRDQLTAWLADCDKLSENFSRLPYKEQVLKNLIFSYNNCGKDTADMSDNQKAKVRIEFSLIAGFSATKVNYNTSVAYNVQMKFPYSSGATFGAGLTIPLARNRQKFAFYTDVLFNHFQSRSNSAALTDLISQTRELNYSSIKWDILFRYRYPDGKLRPFFNGGVFSNFIINNKSKLETYDQVGSSTAVEPVFYDNDGFRKLQFGFIAGIGVRTGRLSLEGRFEAGQSLSVVLTSNAPTTSFSLLAAIGL